MSSHKDIFTSYNPSTGNKIWEGISASLEEIDQAILACRKAFDLWSNLPFETRVIHLQNFQKTLKEDLLLLATVISEETGKPLWDSKGEVNAMISKIDISIKAYQDRCKDLIQELPQGTSRTKHKPHGVVAVFGPYNFPCHLPNGHIIPALLAGNTCIFKPSELTPRTAETTMKIWDKSGLPKNVITLILGGKETGINISKHPGINGLFFTGSFNTGLLLANRFASQPEKILALEMGGNNPLIVHHISDFQAASYMTIQSAFLTSGQRCTCARRLIVPEGLNGDAFLNELIKWIKKIKVGSFTDVPEPFMGPVVSLQIANDLLKTQDELINASGQPLIEMKMLKKNLPFLSPGLIDVTAIKDKKDREIFGPLLQVIRVKDFDAAIFEANQTTYGLSAGLLSESETDYEQFYKKIKAGVLSWNSPMTGASSYMPFGGIGHSGNFRPSAYYAADYCAYPVASTEKLELKMPKIITPGIEEP